jgi:hypothetical protein
MARNGRLTSDRMFEGAELVFESRMSEFEKLDYRRKQMEKDYPWVIGDGLMPDPAPRGIVPSYEMLVTRLDSMSKELQQAAGVRQRALREQVNTLREAGDLLPVAEVVKFLQMMMVDAKTHVIPAQTHLLESKMRTTMQEFLRQNPAGALVAAGEERSGMITRELNP